MPRLLSTIAILGAVCFSFGARPASAAAVPHATSWTHVYVQLSGSPLAADRNLIVRDHATRFRSRIDTSLPSATSYAAALTRYQNTEITYLRQHGITLHLGYQYHLLLNGFSATIPANQEARLRSLANVSAVTPVRKTYPMLDRSLPLVNTPQAWSVLGGSAKVGRGLMIADIDTGIDMSNPCFKDTGFAPPPLGRRADSTQNFNLTNNKVIVIRAFGQDGSKHFSADDVVGHGTFTGSIEACDFNTPTPLGTHISGVAPGAYLMVYNIRPDTQGDDTGFSDPDIAAFEAALQDGADVVNYSFGSVFGSGDERLDPYTAAINLAVKAGLTFVVAAGNAGPMSQSVSSPATADGAIAVGAATNSRSVTATVHISGSGPAPQNLQSMAAKPGSHPFSTEVGPARMVQVGLGRLPNDDPDNINANDFTGKDLRGKIALIQRGTTFFETKINNAAKAGAVGAIIYDNRKELVVFGMDVKSATLPAMAISQADGQALVDYLKSHPDATATLDPKKIGVDETPDIVSEFSARGYGSGYRIKPDLVAPGQDIYAAAETSTPSGELWDPSGFMAADGTSFSAPHVSGGVALLLQAHPKLTPSMVKDVLTETASTSALTDPHSPTPAVMSVGSGMMDIAAAIAAPAYIGPSSVSLGQVNVGYGTQQQSQQLVLNDLGGGSGAWTSSVKQLHGADGLTVTAPAGVQLSANGKVQVPVQFNVGAGTANGDYDGYIFLQHGSTSLHVPYFVHVANKAVTQGSVLLVDSTVTHFQPQPPNAPIQRKDVSKWWEDALNAIHRPFTYWDTGVLGSPSLTDMKRASAVIYFTGANLNGYSHENSDPQALDGPMNSIDVANLHAYMDGGGKVFVSGLAAALSDPTWAQFVLGAAVASLSNYDNSVNDKASKGGISPPAPSAVVDSRIDVKENKWAFSGMKAIDFSTKGDGAGDNLAVSSQATPIIFGPDQTMVGVTGLIPWAGKDNFFGAANGQAALRTTNLSTAAGGADVGIVNTDEPTFKHKTSFKGRSILFSFNFEGINDNTGYATRAQVLQRVLQYLDDTATATLAAKRYASRGPVQLRAAFKSSTGARIVQYAWQVGGATLKPTAKPTRYTFPRTGNFNVRVQITDSLGHTAVSKWTRITVH